MINFTDQEKFMLGAAQSVLPGDMNDTPITPDNKHSEGIDSAGDFQVAPYLPLIRYNREFRTYVVISSQTPVAHATDPKTGESFLVPAGYAIAMEEGDKELVYTDLDVQQGVLGPDGKPVAAGDSVVDKLKASNIKVSAMCGIINYNAFRHPGGNGINPAQLRYRNYNPQPCVSFNMDYVYEYPMVKDGDEYKKAPLKGISAFVGKKAFAGQFITYNKHSQFVVAEEDAFGYGSTKPERIVGQVMKVTHFKDPESGELTKNTFNNLDKVVNIAHPFMDNTGLNSMPGHNNNGLVTKLTYANAFGLITLALQTR